MEYYFDDIAAEYGKLNAIQTSFSNLLERKRKFHFLKSFFHFSNKQVFYFKISCGKFLRFRRCMGSILVSLYAFYFYNDFFSCNVARFYEKKTKYSKRLFRDDEPPDIGLEKRRGDVPDFNIRFFFTWEKSILRKTWTKYKRSNSMFDQIKFKSGRKDQFEIVWGGGEICVIRCRKSDMTREIFSRFFQKSVRNK